MVKERRNVGQESFLSLMGCDGGLPGQTSWELAEGWRRARRGLHPRFLEATASGSGAVMPIEQEVPLPQRG